METVLENVDPEILLQARKVSTDSEGSKDAESLPEAANELETAAQKGENDAKNEESSVKDDQLEDEPTAPLEIRSDVDETDDKCKTPSIDNPTNDDSKASVEDAANEIDEDATVISPVPIGLDDDLAHFCGLIRFPGLSGT